MDQVHVFEGELASDEGIRWTGRPHWWRFVPVTVARFLFGILLAAAGLSMLIEALSQEGWGARLFVLVFALLPLVFAPALLCPLPWAIRRARRTLYVVTDRRAISFYRGVSSTSIRSFGPEQLTELQRKEKRDGSGDITFVSASKALGRTEREQRWACAEGLGFFGIENVTKVEALLKDLAAQASPPVSAVETL